MMLVTEPAHSRSNSRYTATQKRMNDKTHGYVASPVPSGVVKLTLPFLIPMKPFPRTSPANARRLRVVLENFMGLNDDELYKLIDVLNRRHWMGGIKFAQTSVQK